MCGRITACLVITVLASASLAAADGEPARVRADLAFPGETIDLWHGAKRHRFQFEGRTAWVVEPADPLPGNPWSWCMMFPDAFTARCAAPQLVAKGFHHAYLDVGNSFGSPDAVAKLAAFHDELVRRGLAAKPALIGISRGGLYAHRYAAEHPDHVAVIYGDAAVCDFKSWPGGKGKGKGSPGDWKACLAAYGFADEAAALAYGGNPIDALEPLAKAGVALVHVVGDADDVVPPAENTAIVEERYKKLGGTIEVIHKPGVGHHPHGLDDPQPVVDFILRHAAPPAAELDPEAKADAEKAAALLREVKLPEGFAATVFATPRQANYPVFVAATYDGTLFVSSDGNGSLGRDPDRGRILRLRDRDGDGRADEVRVFVADLDSPRGLVWVDDRLVVLHPPDISAFRDADGDGVAEERTELVRGIAFDYSKRPADHTSNGLALGPDGWIYAAIGDFGFMDAVGTDGRHLQLRGGGVVRFRPDGTGLDLFARGTRNTLEVAVGPLLDLVARDNTNDGGGWNVRLHAFTGLEDHGYPRRFINFTDEVVAPLADFGGGSGCGACWIDEPWMPAAWNDAPFTCDWGRSEVFRHGLRRSGAGYEPAGQDRFLGIPRSTDLDVDAAGHLFAASWRGGGFSWSGPDIGFIARVVPVEAVGRPSEPLPADMAAVTTDELVRLLTGPSHRMRLEAQRALLRRGLDDAARSAVTALAADGSARLASRVIAIFTLALAERAAAVAMLEARATDAAVAAYAVRALGDLAASGVAVPRGTLAAALGATDARTRAEALVALARTGDASEAARILPLSGDADPIVAHTAVEAAVRLATGQEAAVVAASCALLDDAQTSPAIHRGAARVLGELHVEAAADAVIARLAAARDPARRTDLARAAARLWCHEPAWKGESWGTRPDTRGPSYGQESWAASNRLAAALVATLEPVPAEELPAIADALGRHRLPTTLVVPVLVSRSDAGAALVAFLERTDGPPPEAAIPVVAKAAADAAAPPERRLSAIRVLARSPDPAVLEGLVDAVAAVEAADGAAAPARAALRTSAAAAARPEAVIALASRGSAQAALVDDILLGVAGSSDAKSAARGQAAAWLAAEWQRDPARRADLVAASVRTGSKVLATVLVAAADQTDDAPLAAAAKDALKRLAIDPVKVREIAADTGPKVGARKPQEVIRLVDETRGDRAIGAELFVAKKCVSCHAAGVDSAGLGPSLANAAGIYNRKQLVEHVLLPNKSIAQGFATTALLLDDGRQLVGFVTSEAADVVVLRDAQGIEHRVPKDSIDERTKLPTSVMPEGLVADLGIAEFASLVDYIEALGK
jgi:putative heme-binding domain-containing protein